MSIYTSKFKKELCKLSVLRFGPEQSPFFFPFASILQISRTFFRLLLQKKNIWETELIKTKTVQDVILPLWGSLMFLLVKRQLIGGGAWWCERVQVWQTLMLFGFAVRVQQSGVQPQEGVRHAHWAVHRGGQEGQERQSQFPWRQREKHLWEQCHQSQAEQIHKLHGAQQGSTTEGRVIWLLQPVFNIWVNLYFVKQKQNQEFALKNVSFILVQKMKFFSVLWF